MCLWLCPFFLSTLLLPVCPHPFPIDNLAFYYFPEKTHLWGELPHLVLSSFPSTVRCRGIPFPFSDTLFALHSYWRHAHSFFPTSILGASLWPINMFELFPHKSKSSLDSMYLIFSYLFPPFTIKFLGKIVYHHHRLPIPQYFNC